MFELADGRELAWIEYGAVDGSPVMAFHGSGGTRHHFASQADVAAMHGFIRGELRRHLGEAGGRMRILLRSRLPLRRRKASISEN